MVPYEAFKCRCGNKAVVLRESYKPESRGKLCYACPRSKPREDFLDVDFFMERETSSSTGRFSWRFIDYYLFSRTSNTSNIFFTTFNTSKPSPRNIKKCRMLKLKHFLGKIKVLEATLEMYMHLKQHTHNLEISHLTGVFRHISGSKGSNLTIPSKNRETTNASEFKEHFTCSQGLQTLPGFVLGGGGICGSLMLSMAFEVLLIVPDLHLDIPLGSMVGGEDVEVPIHEDISSRAEKEHQSELHSRLANFIIPQMYDRWYWSLEATRDFLVKSVHNLVEDSLLYVDDMPMRCVAVILIKYLDYQMPQMKSYEQKKCQKLPPSRRSLLRDVVAFVEIQELDGIWQ
uniref:Uncharacterized protein n=1 Tax=Tanacetum cinerariifolium TaxID=118510 RepID=A0A6L2LM89_TANCI|nr:hypothetical protein [Tanacetum cinerariifolium]